MELNGEYCYYIDKDHIHIYCLGTVPSGLLCEDVHQDDLIQFHDDGVRLASIFQPDLMDISSIDSLVNRLSGRSSSFETREEISKYVKDNEVLDRVKRDGGYGHHCSNPFAIFPFLSVT